MAARQSRAELAEKVQQIGENVDEVEKLSEALDRVTAQGSRLQASAELNLAVRQLACAQLFWLAVRSGRHCWLPLCSIHSLQAELSAVLRYWPCSICLLKAELSDCREDMCLLRSICSPQAELSDCREELDAARRERDAMVVEGERRLALAIGERDAALATTQQVWEGCPWELGDWGR